MHNELVYTRTQTHALYISQTREPGRPPRPPRVKEGNSTSYRAAPESSMIYSSRMMGHIILDKNVCISVSLSAYNVAWTKRENL